VKGVSSQRPFSPQSSSVYFEQALTWAGMLGENSLSMDQPPQPLHDHPRILKEMPSPTERKKGAFLRVLELMAQLVMPPGILGALFQRPFRPLIWSWYTSMPQHESGTRQLSSTFWQPLLREAGQVILDGGLLHEPDPFLPHLGEPPHPPGWFWHGSQA